MPVRRELEQAKHLQPAVVIERNGDLLVDRGRFEPLTGKVISERTIVRGRRVRRFGSSYGCSASRAAGLAA